MLKEMSWLRVFLVMVLLTITFYHIDIKPILNTIANLNTIEQQLMAEENAHQPSASPFYVKVTIVPPNQMDVVKYIITLLEKSEFAINEMQPKKVYQQDELEVVRFSLMLSGNFSQLNKLITNLNEGNKLITIEDMIVKNIEHENIKIDMTVGVFNIEKQSNVRSGPHTEMFEWIGYMKTHDGMVGLLKMANGDIQTVHAGSFINHGALNILSLNAEKMLVKSKENTWTVNYDQAL